MVTGYPGLFKMFYKFKKIIEGILPFLQIMPVVKLESPGTAETSSNANFSLLQIPIFAEQSQLLVKT